jgi:tetratricopeptide (TPR) repeat protein
VPRFRRFVWRLLKRPGPPPGITIEDAIELFERGMELSQQGHPQKALEIARELDGYRYTGAWEVEAAALREMGDADGAIEVLRSGIDKKPVWRIGHLLGIYLSDERRYEEALEAFDASLGMHQANQISTRYNQAIVHHRAGRTDQAIKLLQETISSKSLGDEQEALELASAFLAKLTENGAKLPPRRHSTKHSARRRR